MPIGLLFVSLICLTTSLSVNSPCHPSHHNIQNDISVQVITSRTKRGATAVKRSLWPNGIVPFSISKEFHFDVAHNLQRAMRIWEKHSCIRFVKHTNESFGLRFEPQDCGCCSFVGMQHFSNGKPQELSIKGENCEDIGHMLHEIGHALGFWHEHVRPDRDRYVKLNKTNIESEAKHNFRKKNLTEINSLGEPYDYKSIMHYSAFSFALNPHQRTLKPRRRHVLIGQREKLSRGDIVQINKLYGCPADENACETGTHRCQHHCVNLFRGYRCTCRRGYILLSDGRSCSLQCRPWLRHSQGQGLIFSPNFPHFYETELSCEWNLNAPSGYHVSLRLLKFHLEDGGESCNFDVLQVWAWTNEWRLYRTLCGKLSSSHTYSIPYSNIQLRFKSDSSIQRQGFKLFYKFTPSPCALNHHYCVSNLVAPPKPFPVDNICTKEYHTSTGVLDLPYTRPITCTAKLKLRTYEWVKVEIGNLQMRESPGCGEEHVVIRRSEGLVLVATVCGSQSLQIFWIKTRLLWISYRAVHPHSTMNLRYSVTRRGTL